MEKALQAASVVICTGVACQSAKTLMEWVIRVNQWELVQQGRLIVENTSPLQNRWARLLGPRASRTIRISKSKRLEAGGTRDSVCHDVG